jgi:hypothetical protein
VRVWRTRIDPARTAEYDDFARTKSVPMFRAQPGFCGVLFTSHGDARAVITLWKSRESALALHRSPTYAETVAALEDAGFLAGEQTTELVDLDGFYASERPAFTPAGSQQGG